MNVSPSAEVYLKPETPRNMRLMAAKGAVPLVPGDLLIVLFRLSQDPDPEIGAEAARSLTSTPPNILKSVLTSDLPSPLLDYFVRLKKDDASLMEILVLNKQTSDEAISEVARSNNPKILEIISHNQERMMRSAKILNALLENPYLSQTSRDRLLEFFAPSSAALPAEKEAALPAERTAELPTPVTAELPQALAAVDLPKELLEDKKGPISEAEHKSLYQKIQQMSAAAKIKLALLGSKEARAILIRDPNKLVASAVVKSPKITDSEVALVAQSRNVSDEVLRLISGNKDWVKNYQIKLALVSNPKTPLPIAMKHLFTLKEGDLKQLSMSRNVSGAIASAAKKHISIKG